MKLGINELENEIGVPKGFFDSLSHEDSWSFIIKLHAFLESLLSISLSLSLHQNSLLDEFIALPMSASKYGKIIFAKKIGLLDSEMVRFFRSLSELRNLLVHNVSNVTFSLKKYYEDLPTKQKDSFYKKFSIGLIRSGDDNLTNKILFEESPQTAIHLGGIAIVYDLHLKHKEAEIIKKGSSLLLTHVR